MRFDVLLVDDHKIMRDGIKAILKHSEEFSVVGEAERVRMRCRWLAGCAPESY